MATYMTNAVNTSPIISQKAGEACQDIRGLAVKFDDNGKVVPAKVAGEAVLGIAIITAGDTEGGVKADENVDIQIFGTGLAKAGAAIKAGDNLAADATGKLVPATDGQFVIGTALKAAGAGAMVNFLMWRAFAK